MSRLVDEGFTAAWPAWARGVWVAVMFASLIAAVYAWKRLIVDPPA